MTIENREPQHEHRNFFVQNRIVCDPNGVTVDVEQKGNIILGAVYTISDTKPKPSDIDRCLSFGFLQTYKLWQNNSKVLVDFDETARERMISEGGID